MGKRQHSANRQKYLASVKRQKTHNSGGSRGIPINIRGFLFTYGDGKEREATREAFNLLNEYAELFELKLPPTTANDANTSTNSESDSDSDEEDIATALKRETQQLNAESNANNATLTKEERQLKNDSQLFRQYNVRVRNCLFVGVNVRAVCAKCDNDVGTFCVQMLHHMLESKTQKCRHLQRITPVHQTLSTNAESVSKAINTIVPQYFKTTESPTYAVWFKARNNDTVDKTFVLDCVTVLVKQCSPLAKVDLTKAQLTISVEILGTVTCVSVLKEFNSLKRYNLHTIFEEEKVKTDEMRKVDDTSEQDAITGEAV